MIVKQIANLLDLLDFFARAKRPLSVAKIIKEFGWARSSAFNIISTLVERGYLYQTKARGGYFPTSKWMEFARQMTEAQPLPESVRDLLVQIMKETGETAVLAAPAGTNVVFLDVVDPPAAVRFICSIGERQPIHVTSSGQAILSQYSATERARTLKRIKYQRYKPDSPMSPETVERNIQKGLKRGWFLNVEGYAPGVSGIGVPFVFGERRDAIVVGAPTERVKNHTEEIATKLRGLISRFLDEHA